MSRCVTYREVIDSLGRLPTRQSELIVLAHLLRRRCEAGDSVQKLYAGLLLAALDDAPGERP